VSTSIDRRGKRRKNDNPDDFNALGYSRKAMTGFSRTTRIHIPNEW
jgi:hypothetical protein